MASEQCRPHYILKIDDNCFYMDCLPTLQAGHDLEWTGLYMRSFFSWEKWQVTCQPSSKWHYCPDVYLPYASGIGYIKRFWWQPACLPHPYEGCGRGLGKSQQPLCQAQHAMACL